MYVNVFTLLCSDFFQLLFSGVQMENSGVVHMLENNRTDGLCFL